MAWEKGNPLSVSRCPCLASRTFCLLLPPPPSPRIWPPDLGAPVLTAELTQSCRVQLRLPGLPLPRDAPGCSYSTVFLEEVPSVSLTPPIVNLSRKPGNALWNLNWTIRWSRSLRSSDDSCFGTHFIPKGKSILLPWMLWNKLQRFRKSKNKCFPSAELSQGANPQIGFNFLSCNAF